MHPSFLEFIFVLGPFTFLNRIYRYNKYTLLKKKIIKTGGKRFLLKPQTNTILYFCNLVSQVKGPICNFVLLLH